MPDSTPAIDQAWINQIIHAIDQNLRPQDTAFQAQLRLALMDAHQVEGCPRASQLTAASKPGVVRRLTLLENHSRNYDLLLLVWPPGYRGEIHDHAGQMGLEIVLDGQLVFETFAVSPATADTAMTLLLLNEARQRPGDAAHFGGSQHAHRCINPSESQASLSLHIYSRHVSQCRFFFQDSMGNWQCGTCDLVAESPANLSR